MSKNTTKSREELIKDVGELRKKSKEREENLKAANQQLQASNQQLQATEQQLRAANQQLQASNQQLRATEQQLRAANQQLQASNQQLRATEQQLRAANQQLEASNIEIRKKEALANEAKNYAENIIATLREPLLILNADLKVITANNSFYNTFRTTENDTVGNYIFELGNHQWDIPELRKLLLQILPDKSKVVDFEVEHIFRKLGQKTMLLNSKELIQEDGKKKMILLAIEDITDRRRAEDELKSANQQLEANNQQLRATEQQLRAANQQLEESNQQLIVREQMLKKQSHDLGERLKELNCFYGLAQIVEIHNISLEEIIQRTVEIIPASWQYPEITVCRIILDNKEYKTPNFKKTNWSQRSKIIIDGIHAGEIEVCYLKKMPDSDEGSFLKEERLLLDALAERLGRITNRMQAEDELKSANQQLQASNQQLQATEQQLRAANHQLEAYNQQLIAGEHALIKEKNFAEKIVETANAIIIGLDENHRIKLFNRGAEKITGYKKEEVLGKDWFEIFFPKEIIDEMNRVWESAWGVKSQSYTNPIISKSGELRTISWQNTGIYNDEDVSKHLLLSIGEDITQRKQAEKELQESEELFRTVFETAQDSIFIKDTSLRYTKANPQLLKLFGFNEDNLIGKTDADIFGKDIAKEIKRKDKKVLAGEVVDEITEKPINGILHTFHTIKVPIRNSKGKITGLCGIARDVTEQKQVEKELTKLSTAVTQSPSVIAITDTKGNLEYINPRFTELTGYSFDEVRGKNPRILKSGEQAHEMYKELWQTISSGKVWHGEFHNKKKNGELFWESASVSPIFDEHGKIINYIKVAEDITERKRNEEIQNIIHQISNAVAISHNPEEFIALVRNELGAIIDVSNFYVTLYDSAEDSISLLHHDDEKDRLKTFPAGKTLTKYVIKTKKPLLATKKVKDKLTKLGEVELLGADSKVWLGVPLFAEGKVSGVIAVQSYKNEKAYDKTDMKMLEIISPQISISLERKKSEQDLKAALEKAQESDRLKSAFLLNMSHEIRTPMNGILGFTNLLKNSHLSDAEIKEYTEIIEKSGNRMLNTINDIVDISKIEAGHVHVENSEISINKVLKELYDFFKVEAQSKGLELIYHPALSDDEAQILTDKPKVEGILTNLIKNALKFTHRGHITFGCLRKQEKDIEVLKFYVKDTGIGIPKNRIEAIFNRFEKADIEDTKVYEGSGLGLAISKSYVEILGGNIRVSSKEGSGTIFIFSIPYIKQSTKETDIKLKHKDENHASLKDLSLIIVEDDKVSSLYLQTIFKNKFRKILYATTGREAIDICRQNPQTDIILMDIRMPDMNGYDAAREIRKFNQDVVIIAQTAFGLLGDREKALEAGCNDYISKPINKDLLMEKIMRYAKKY